MKTSTNELEALLWSKKSKSFHIEKLSKTIEHGQRSFSQDSDPDYIVVGVAESIDGLRSVREALVEHRPDWNTSQSDE
jgi:hypothetical protein